MMSHCRWLEVFRNHGSSKYTVAEKETGKNTAGVRNDTSEQAEAEGWTEHQRA